MNKRNANKKQMSLSQSLFRSRATKKDSNKNLSENNHQDIRSPTAKSRIDRPNSDNETISQSRSEPEGEDCDDSFDLFLPKKNQPKSTSSQESFFVVKKRSKYFNKSGELQVPKVISDDNLELALAVSLEESKGNSVLLKPSKTEGNVTYLKPAKSDSNQSRVKQKRICTNSLLMRRTTEERERIITEKVAIVLMDKGKDVSKNVNSRPFDSFSPYSSHLRKQMYELKTLWSLAQTDLSQIKLENFFIDSIIHYLPTNCMEDIRSTSADPPAEECLSTSLQRACSTEDMFGRSDEEDSDQVPSPKRPRRSLSLEDLDKIDPATNNPADENEDGLSLKVDSHDIISLVVEESDSSDSVSNSGACLDDVACHYDRVNITAAGFDDVASHSDSVIYTAAGSDDVAYHPVRSTDIILQSQSDSSHSLPKIGAGLGDIANHSTKSTREVNASPSNSSESRQNCIATSNNHELFDSPSRPPDVSRHYLQLSADMLRIVNSKISRISEVINGTKKFQVHHCIFQVRCPKILDELEKNPDCFANYSSVVCEALFGYIYAADIRSCLNLDFEQRRELLECANKFRISCLVEALKANCCADEEDHHSTIVCEVNQPTTPFNQRQSNLNRTFESEKPDVVRQAVPDQVIVINSDSCSAEEIAISEGPTSECAFTEDDDLKKYSMTGESHSEDEKLRRSRKTSKSPVLDKSPSNCLRTFKTSIDRYFEDSFPSLTDIGVSVTPTLPVVRNETPEPSKPQTIVDCVTPLGELVISERATPLPDYDTMLSPELQDALHKYGVRRGIGRRKAVTLLRYIYDQIHPPADHPAVTKALNDVKNTCQADASAGSDNDICSLSSDSGENMELFEDLGDVVDSQPDRSDCDRSSLLRQIGGFIKNNTLLYAAILTYEPIWLNKFHKTLKDGGIKCSKRNLMDVLDELCLIVYLLNLIALTYPVMKFLNPRQEDLNDIPTYYHEKGITFRTEQTEKQLRRKGSRRKTNKKS